MKTLVVTLLLCLFAVAASADAIVIPFSGSGASGTIAPGESWAVNAETLQSWGSPGSGLNTLIWPGAPTPGDITDFTITFTGLGQRR